MNKISLFLFSIILVTVTVYSQAFASVDIWNSGPPKSISGNEPNVIFAADFSLASDERLTDGHFWIQDFFGNFNDKVEYFVYLDDGTNPGIRIAKGSGTNVNSMLDTSLNSLSGCSDDCYKVWFDLPDEPEVNLIAGTDYWFGIRIDEGNIILHNEVVGDTARFSEDEPEAWLQAPNKDMPFILTASNSENRRMVVGGELIPLDTSALLLAGAQINATWLIPVIVSAIGIGIVILRKY